MRGLDEVRRSNIRLAEEIKNQSGFLNKAQVQKLQQINRLMLVLVRCGNGRFLCPVQDVKHFTSIIEEHAQMKEAALKEPFQGDYIRDISLPV